MEAATNHWCISPSDGDSLRITREFWNVHVNPIAENWPDSFPLLVKVYTDDGKLWWASMDALSKYTTIEQ